MERNPLFATNVGSHMWGMERPGSDFDIFVTYIAPTKDILMGTANVESNCTKEGNFDYVYHEIGKVVDMLIKGNVNYYWGVLSPRVASDSHFQVRDAMRHHARSLMSKECSKSILGLARHNYERYLRDGLGEEHVDGKLKQKKINVVLRTLEYGVFLMEHPHMYPRFAAVKDGTVKDVENWMVALDSAADNSELPDKPSEERIDAVRDYLLKLRMLELVGAFEGDY